MLKKFLRGIGTLVIIILLFFTLTLGVFLGPDIVVEPSLMDGPTLIIWSIWMMLLLIAYIKVTRSFILNLLMILLLECWAPYIFDLLTSPVTLLDKLMALEGFIVVLSCFMIGIVKSDLIKDLRERRMSNFK